MKTSVVRSTWLPIGGYRLDCSPYLGGAIETEILLEELPVKKESLETLTKAIFNGPQFVRNYVADPEYGVPFMTGSTMLLADLSDLPLLSKRDAYGAKLRHLEIEPGMSLISCSGSIGKMSYAREEMKGVWASQDILKVVPDPDKIPPGYLYAFLSSKFGVPLITSGTYGAIIQHLEPQHIAKLSVPRFAPALENEIHTLIEKSGKLFSEQTSILAQATKEFFDSVGLRDVTPFEWRNSCHLDLGYSVTEDISRSFRAQGYSPRVRLLRERIEQTTWKPLGSLCKPGILARSSRFTRIDSAKEFGARMIGQRELFSYKPEGRWIASIALPPDAFVEDGTICVAARGTLGEGELYCRSQFITGPWTKIAFSEDILRILTSEMEILRGCLFSFMRSETAFRLLRSVSSGTKLQEPNYWLLPRIPIPVPAKQDQIRIDKMVKLAYTMRHQAVDFENKATNLVEEAIKNPQRAG